MMLQRKKYSKEFKIDAINLVREQGYSCSEAAKSLDVAYDVLNRWIRESKK
jgi:transposase